MRNKIATTGLFLLFLGALPFTVMTEQAYHQFQAPIPFGSHLAPETKAWLKHSSTSTTIGSTVAGASVDRTDSSTGTVTTVAVNKPTINKPNTTTTSTTTTTLLPRTIRVPNPGDNGGSVPLPVLPIIHEASSTLVKL